MGAIHYAEAHQLISALHSIVAVPRRHWLRSGLKAPPTKDAHFLLDGRPGPTGERKLKQPTEWRVQGPVWTLEPRQTMDEGCLDFLRSLWPFYDDWVRTNDEVFCFRAVLLQRPATEQLARWVADELASLR